MPAWLILLQGIIILTLALIAIYYCVRLYKLRNRIRKQEAEQTLEAGIRRDEINNSIQILCRSLIAGQVESSEASLRISALMDQLSVPESRSCEFVAFDTMAAAIKHIPILDAWKSLSKIERQQYRVVIQKKQEELDEFVVEAARKMIGQSF